VATTISSAITVAGAVSDFHRFPYYLENIQALMDVLYEFFNISSMPRHTCPRALPSFSRYRCFDTRWKELKSAFISPSIQVGGFYSERFTFTTKDICWKQFSCNWKLFLS